MNERQYHISVVAFLVVLAILGIIWFKGCPITKMNPGVVKPIENITRWENKAGDSVASLKGYQAQFALREKQIADSLASLYQVKIKNLQEYIIAFTATSGEVDPEPGTKEADYFPVHGKDCPPVIKNYRQHFSNPYYAIRAQIGDSSYLHLKSFDTITVLWKRQKEGSIFNRKKFLQLDISTANPFTSITGLHAYRIPEKKTKAIGIGLQAGYGFQAGIKPAPYIGIGVSYNLIRF